MAAVYPFEDTGVAEDVACLRGGGGLDRVQADGAEGGSEWGGRGDGEDGEEGGG